MRHLSDSQTAFRHIEAAIAFLFCSGFRDLGLSFSLKRTDDSTPSLAACARFIIDNDLIVEATFAARSFMYCHLAVPLS